MPEQDDSRQAQGEGTAAAWGEWQHSVFGGLFRTRPKGNVDETDFASAAYLNALEARAAAGDAAVLERERLKVALEQIRDASVVSNGGFVYKLCSDAFTALEGVSPSMTADLMDEMRRRKNDAEARAAKAEAERDAVVQERDKLAEALRQGTVDGEFGTIAARWLECYEFEKARAEAAERQLQEAQARIAWWQREQGEQDAREAELRRVLREIHAATHHPDWAQEHYGSGAIGQRALDATAAPDA